MTDDSDPLTPEQAGLAAAAADLASGGVIAIGNGLLTKVHHPSLCEGTACWVHNPSVHHMTSWPIHWRQDKATAERICAHGVGHPDPDDANYHARVGRDVRIHGCDGCCSP